MKITIKTTALTFLIAICQISANAQATAYAQNSVNTDTLVTGKSGSEEMIQNIIEDLFRMKIITDKKRVAFALSYDKLEVNNKKQPEEVLEKLKLKYHITKSYSVAYAKSETSTSTSIVK